jgi:3-oxoacyl-[acyl-carrier protein] reductase
MSRTVIITGGAGDIGLTLTESFCSRGDNVWACDICDDSHDNVKKIYSLGAKYFKTDVSSVESIKKSFSYIFSQINSIDILVNNAGITRDSLALRMKENDWDSVLSVNLKGAFFCSQQVLTRMIRQNQSYIINISSIVGLYGNIGQANYAASKAGLIALTKTLSKEYGSRNICVNAIAPGFIKTKMTENLQDNIKQKALERISLNRFGTTQDIANLVLFLTSGQADYITGQVIEISGGIN